MSWESLLVSHLKDYVKMKCVSLGGRGNWLTHWWHIMQWWRLQYLISVSWSFLLSTPTKLIQGKDDLFPGKCWESSFFFFFITCFTCERPCSLNTVIHKHPEDKKDWSTTVNSQLLTAQKDCTKSFQLHCETNSNKQYCCPQKNLSRS